MVGRVHVYWCVALCGFPLHGPAWNTFWAQNGTVTAAYLDLHNQEIVCHVRPPAVLRVSSCVCVALCASMRVLRNVFVSMYAILCVLGS